MNQQNLQRLSGYLDMSAFAKTLLPHHFSRNLTNFHKRLMGEEKIPYKLRVRGWRRAIAAPRGAGKSTIKTLLEPIHDICYGFEPFIVIMANTSQQVSALASSIRDELEHNHSIKQMFPELYPIKSTQSDIITANNRRISARSAGQQIRGIRHRQFRPTKIILDDIEHSLAAGKFARREEFEEYMNRDVLQAGSPKTIIEHVGTILHPQSLLAKHMKSAGWSSQTFESVQGWPERLDLWSQCRKIWSDLSNPNREKDARTFFESNRFEMMRGAKVLDEEQEDLLDLMILLWRDGEAAFWAEKQNQPQMSSAGILPMNRAKLFDMNEINIHSMTLSLWLDPSLGSENSGDPAAIVVVARSGDGSFFVIDAWVGYASPSEQIKRLLLAVRKYDIKTVGFENNGFQRLLLPIFNELKHKLNLPWASLQGFTSTENKLTRIATIEPMIANGWIKFNKKLLYSRYWEDMSKFPAGHDDAPDATERAIFLLSKRITQWSYS